MGWSSVGNLTAARGVFGRIKLSTGQIFAIGGIGGGVGLTSVNLYNPLSQTWSSVASIPIDSCQVSCVELNDGTILVFGIASNNNNTNVVNSYTYDPIGDSWTRRGDMVNAHGPCAFGKLPSGKVLAACGPSSDSTAEIYDPTAHTWSATTAPNHRHVDMAFATLPDGRILLSGDAGATPHIEYFTESGSTWTDVTIPGGITTTTAADDENPMILLKNGTVLNVGNSASNGSIQSSCFIFDPNMNTCTATGSLSTARSGMALCLLLDGQVVAVGGTPDHSSSLSSCEIYNPNLGTWSAAPTLNQSRWIAAWGNVGIVLNDGRALAIGGWSGADNSTALNSTEVLTLSSNDVQKTSMQLVF